MLSPRLKKIIRDLYANRGRTILAILAMTVSLIGIGTVLCSYSILLREINANYMQTEPASASLYLKRIDKTLIEEIERTPEIKEVEARGLYQARFEISNDKWKTILLFVIKDFDELRLNKFTHEKGAWPPKKGEILLERVAFRVAQARIGEKRDVFIPGHEKVKLHITGSVYDPGKAPAWMEGLVYGYITPETLLMLGEENLNELNITVARNYFDRKHVIDVVKNVRDQIETLGYPVISMNVPVPGEHPHAGQLSALLFLMQAFGILGWREALALTLPSFLLVLGDANMYQRFFSARDPATARRAVIWLAGALDQQVDQAHGRTAVACRILLEACLAGLGSRQGQPEERAQDDQDDPRGLSGPPALCAPDDETQGNGGEDRRQRLHHAALTRVRRRAQRWLSPRSASRSRSQVRPSASSSTRPWSRSSAADTPSRDAGPPEASASQALLRVSWGT